MVRIKVVRLLAIFAALSMFSSACGLSSESPTDTSLPATPLVIPIVETATSEPSTEMILLAVEPTPYASCPPPVGWSPVTIQAEDTLESLAQLYNVTVEALVQTNCLVTQDLTAGAILFVPGVPSTEVPIPCGPPPGWILYMVQPGDTLFHIAMDLEVTVAELQAANCLDSSTLVRIGQRIFVPDVSKQTPTITPVQPTATSPEPSVTATLAPFSIYAPVGFVADSHDGVGLSFYNLDGSFIDELTAPGLSEHDSQRVHVAGQWVGDLASLPVVYFSSQGPAGKSGVDWLRIVAGSETPIWLGVSQFFTMVGAPGQPVLAYSTLDFEESRPRSRLYASNLQNLPGASPLFVIADPDGYAVRPLAVDAEAGVLKGIWYTMAAWGIGGDVVFEPRKGMKYLDMRDGILTEILNRDQAAWEISPDRTWVAYSRLSGPLSVLNRNTGETVSYPLLPDSNRGAGNARISPDGLHVAWVEGSGWTMTEDPDFHATIRIATTAGVLLADIPQTAFENLASSENVSWIEPVGWLDGQTLIVQARFQEWNNAALIRIHVDGSNPLYLATGTFVAFLYQ
jgi:LysM repeat protein